MTYLKSLLLGLIFGATLYQPMFAATPNIKSFTPDSMDEILNANQHRSLILVLWSIDCPSCLEEMQLLSDFHQQYPQKSLIMIAIDPPSAHEQIQLYLEQYELTDIENWIFAEQDPEVLRRTIDPAWRGEIPRTYFYSSTGTRKGYSGLLRKTELEKLSRDKRLQ